MSDERRRYFRITETVGISYQFLDGDETKPKKASGELMDLYSLVSDQDEKIEKLIIEVAEDNPKVAALVSLLNQKLERIFSQLVMDSQLVGRIAHKMREASISACGIGFMNDEATTPGVRLRLELTLYPSEHQISTLGQVISCDRGRGDKSDEYFWRVDFYGMNEANQESLIQHVVRSQSNQLKVRREEIEAKKKRDGSDK